MAIPIVLGAAVIELKDLVATNLDYSLLIVSFIITFLVSLFTIKLLLKIIKTDKFYLFGVYNFVLGILVVIWSLK
jgi:undecaprenyl-diphosphatase